MLLGRVNYIKNYGKKIVGTDIGMNILLRPALYGAYHRIVVANRLDSPPADNVRVVGQICENTDRIGDEIRIQEVSEGDIIAVFNAGAYVYSMSSNYNGFPRPEEVLITRNGEIIIIRERERYHDLISGATLNRYMF